LAELNAKIGMLSSKNKLPKPTKTKAGDDYILEAKVDKTTFFLGDTANLTITFKAKKSLSAFIGYFYGFSSLLNAIYH
jgi:hypothetical protein